MIFKILHNDNYVEFEFDIAVSSSINQIPSTLNECTWEQISQLSESGEFGNYFKVGDTKTIVLNGRIGNGFTANNLAIDLVVAGIDHNQELESPGEHRVHFKLGNIDGVQIALVDSKYNTNVSSTGYFSMNASNTTSGGWNGSQMRSNIMGGNGTPDNPTSNSLMAALPADLRAVMKSVQKYTDNTGNYSNTAGAVTATTEYLCLPAEYEVQGARTYANQYEQSKQKQYDCYKTGSKIHYASSAVGTSCWVRLRSTYAITSSAFCAIHTSGSAYQSNAYSSGGVEVLLFV